MMSQVKLDNLNSAQNKAVNTTEGPVMVVAGPGTGKTQLLASRVVNILKKNSTLLPSNILCLTFTEAGQVAMQKRLLSLMGESGSQVAVHTFHSFGAEIINNYPEHFFNNVQFSPADELTSHEIISDILSGLPLRHQFSGKHNNEYVYIGSIKKRIQQFKKAISPQELQQIVKDSLEFIDYIEEQIIETFDVKTFSKKHIPSISQLLNFAQIFQPKESIHKLAKPLNQVFTETLAAAYLNATETNSTTPITAWKQAWFGKDESGQPVCKQRAILTKLGLFAEIYSSYQQELHNRRLFDFDDMILQAVQAIETKSDLAYELQEKYQYLLVDEFQDTNFVQMRLLNALLDNPFNEAKPNIMVVGDDDQAIFAFQGAELSNILNFADNYEQTAQITLKENYRSSPDILAAARRVITQGGDRLENYVQGLDKSLNPNASFKHKTTLQRLEFEIQEYEFEFIAQDIAKQIKAGLDPQEIAIISRGHKQLEGILPYLTDLSVAVSYERRQNALVNPKIKELLLLAKVVHFLAKDEPFLANELLPELLSAEYWQLSAEEIWDISLTSRQSKENQEFNGFWINTMLKGDQKQHNIAIFLLEAAKYSNTNNLEDTLDLLTGNNDSFVADEPTEESAPQNKKNKPISPFKQYYFSEDKLNKSPGPFIELLSALTALRRAIRSYKPEESHSLGDFIAFCDIANDAKIVVPVTNVYSTGDKPINLLTAHKSKGLEFDTVYILSANQSVWEARGRRNNITLSPNLLSVDHANTPDDNLRLFYVAMTRAKRQLYISNFLVDSAGKETLPFAALEASALKELLPSPPEPIRMNNNSKELINRANRHWHDKHLAVPDSTLKNILQDKLKNYSLSATHLNNFLDIEKGGPQNFFVYNLLQFPSAMNPSASFGSSMHSTLEFIHKNVIKNQQLPNIQESELYLESSLKRKAMLKKDFLRYLQQGKIALQKLYNARQNEFKPNQLPEQNFRSQNVIIGDAKITGKIDVLEIYKNQAKVIDYKTGKGSQSWDPKGKTAYEKQKLHHYKQQLYFYKLLVDGSRNWGSKGITAQTGELVFVEPSPNDIIDTLSLDLNNNTEIERLKRLIIVVWQKIMNLDFPDVSEYTNNLDGIIQFEDWLIENN